MGQIFARALTLVLATVFLAFIGCEKETEIQSNQADSISKSTLESRSDNDECLLSISEELITSTSVNGVSVPTFSSMETFDALEEELFYQRYKSCATAEGLISLTQEIGYTSEWESYVEQQNGKVELTRNMDNVVRKCMMNSDGFTRIGDDLYHWLNPHEVYMIDLSNAKAYTYLANLSEIDVVEIDALLEYDIQLVGSDIREVHMMECNEFNNSYVGVGTLFSPGQYDCDSPQALQAGASIGYSPNVIEIAGTITWGDGTSTTVSHLNPNVGGAFGILFVPNTWLSNGAYEIAYDLEFIFDGGSDVCTTTGSFMQILGDGDCSQAQRSTNYWLNESGLTTDPSTWATGDMGIFMALIKGRTLSGSRFRCEIESFFWNGFDIISVQADHDHSIDAGWRNDECSLLGSSSDSRTETNNFSELKAPTPTRRWKYIQAEDLELTFSVSFPGTAVALSGTRFIAPRCNP